MIKRFILLLIISVSFLSGFGQDCMYIYRNDNDFNAIFIESIDSISFSKYDTAGFLCDDWVTKEVATRDSLYRIPLAAIDSISFVKPETIYKHGVIKIEDNLMPYVVECDSLTIKLSSNTDVRLLPQKGEKLVTLEMNDKFPIGFAGQVVEVRNITNGYEIECELTDLNSIFEQYVGITEPQPLSRAWNPDDIDNLGLGNNIRIFDLPVSQLSASFGPKVEISDLKTSISNSTNVNTTGQIYVQTMLAIGNFVRRTVFSSTIIVDMDTEVSMETSIQGQFAHDFGPKGKINLPCAPLIQLSSSAGLFYKLAGDITARRSYKSGHKLVFHYEHNGDKEAVIPAAFRFIEKTTTEETTEVVGNASFSFGAYWAGGLGILDKELAYVGLRAEAGVTVDVSAEIVRNEESLNTKVYDALDKDDIITLSFFANAGAEVKALCFEGGISFSDKLTPRVLGKWGVVPKFNNAEYQMSDNYPRQFTATSSLSRRCMTNVNVGYDLYDDNDCLVDSYLSPVPYQSETLPLSYTFKNIKPNKKYTIYPYVFLFGNKYLARPFSDMEYEITVNTLDAREITSQSAILYGSVDGLTADDNAEVGFYYSKDNATWHKVSTTFEKDFSTSISNLEADCEYSFYAYALLNEEVVYGETSHFKTEKKQPEIEKIENLSVWSLPYGGILKLDTSELPQGIDISKVYTLHWYENQSGMGSSYFKSYSQGFLCKIGGTLPVDKIYYQVKYTDPDTFETFNLTDTCSFNAGPSTYSIITPEAHIYDDTTIIDENASSFTTRTIQYVSFPVPSVLGLSLDANQLLNLICYNQYGGYTWVFPSVCIYVSDDISALQNFKITGSFSGYMYDHPNDFNKDRYLIYGPGTKTIYYMAVLDNLPQLIPWDENEMDKPASSNKYGEIRSVTISFFDEVHKK